MGRSTAAGRRILILAALGAGLAGCASAPGQSDPADTLGNIFAFNSLKAPPMPAQQQTAPTSLICPIVDVRDGGAAHRVYNGKGTSNADVRYQFSIGETARECNLVNNQITIRVGVEGKVLIGPAGSASSFTVPVFIGVRRDSDQQMVASRVYQAQVSIPAGGAQTSFSVVSETMTVPFTQENAAADYTIYVGFEGQRESRPQRVARRRR